MKYSGSESHFMGHYGSASGLDPDANLLFSTATCEIFIEPPPDTQRTERQGERGM